EADVEPDGRIERAVLIEAQGRQLVVEPLGVLFRGEVSVVATPVGNGPGHAVDQLADAGLPLGCVELAVEVLARDDICCQSAPCPGNLAVDLLEDGPSLLVLDLRRPDLPIHLIERVDTLRAEDTWDDHARVLPLGGPSLRARLSPFVNCRHGRSLPWGHTLLCS